MPAATWRNTRTGKTVAGAYEWLWHAQAFVVQTAEPVSYGGERRRSFRLIGYDTPEWGNWRLIRA